MARKTESGSAVVALTLQWISEHPRPEWKAPEHWLACRPTWGAPESEQG